MDDSEFINAEDVKEYVEKNGVSNIKDFLQQKLDQWKTIPLNVAITGESGSGKSSFINALRGLTDDDEGAAAVGPTETTKIPTRYPHPENESLQFWDLPGVGTPMFPKDRYLEAVEFRRFDFFIICSHARFTEKDLWLAKEVNSQGKKFLFLRTKIDKAIADEKRNRRKNFDESKMLKTIKADAEKNFREAGLDKYHVFLISNWDSQKWDFPSLMKHLIDQLPSLKREVFILSLRRIITADIIEEKKTFLHARIWKVAAMYAARQTIPGLKIADDPALNKEVEFFKNELGLDEASLQALPTSTGMPMGQLPNFLATAGAWVAQKLGLEHYTSFIPYIGPVIAAGVEFGTAYNTLNETLDELVKSAHEVLTHAVKEAVKDAEND